MTFLSPQTPPMQAQIPVLGGQTERPGLQQAVMVLGKGSSRPQDALLAPACLHLLCSLSHP